MSFSIFFNLVVLPVSDIFLLEFIYRQIRPLSRVCLLAHYKTRLHICENINCAVSARLISGVCSFKNKTIQILLFKIGNFKPRSTFCTDWFVYYAAENVGLLLFDVFFRDDQKFIKSGLKTVVIKQTKMQVDSV